MKGVCSAAFSPEGRQIVTGSGDATAKVWDATDGVFGDTTGVNKRVVLKGNTNGECSVKLSTDGQRILTDSRDGTAKVWDSASGRELSSLKFGAPGRDSMCLAFSADGRRVVTSSSLATANVWEIASGRILATLKGHSSVITSAAFSPDGQRIVTASRDRTARVWEAVSGQQLLTLKGQIGPLWCVTFSPDGQRIVTGGWGMASIWDAAGGRELLTLKGHSDEVSTVAFSPDGRRIVTASQSESTARVWQVDDGRELSTLRGHKSGIHSAAFSPDGKRIVTGDWVKTAKVWEAASGRELLTLKGQPAAIDSVVFSPDGQRIVTGSSGEPAVMVWEAATTDQVAGWQQEEREAAESLAALQRKQSAKEERQRIGRERGSIGQWLVLAPIPLATGQNAANLVDTEQIDGEAKLRPRRGEIKSVGGVELKWHELALQSFVLDFDIISGQVVTQGVAYAVCYLESETEQRGLHMLVGGCGEARVYLNGKEVHKMPVPRLDLPHEVEVSDITLNAGLNVLVYKLAKENQMLGDWEGSICFADAEGNPVKGLQVTLDPDAQEKLETKKP